MAEKSFISKFEYARMALINKLTTAFFRKRTTVPTILILSIWFTSPGAYARGRAPAQRVNVPFMGMRRPSARMRAKKRALVRAISLVILQIKI